MLSACDHTGGMTYILENEDNRFLGELIQALRPFGSGFAVAGIISRAQQEQNQIGQISDLRAKIMHIENSLKQQAQEDAGRNAELEEIHSLLNDLKLRIDKINPQYGRF